MARATSANAEEFLTSSQKQVKITQIFFFLMANNKLCMTEKSVLFLLTLQGQRVIL